MIENVLVRMENISKSFSGVLVLDEVSIDLSAGEVHVIIGENGAGKSTLIKILSGYHEPNNGNIYVNGTKVTIKNPYDSHLLGIRAIYQEFSLVTQLSVMDNLFLGLEPTTGKVFISKRKIFEKACDALADLGWVLDPKRKVQSLGVAERQMVEIVKALIQNFSILILDEPTACLTYKEVEKLFDVIKKLKSQGKGIIYISHRLEEIKRIGDRVTVMRNGRKIATLDNMNVDENILIKLMTGRDVKEIFPKIEPATADEVLCVKGLATEGGLKDISFRVNKGEILGVAGLIGSGKSEIGKALFGLTKLSGGEIKLFGRTIKKVTPKHMIENGVQYFPADRHREGLTLQQSLKENITLSSIECFEKLCILRKKKELIVTKDIVKQMDIKPPQLLKKVRYFSGGNQQKILLARGLIRNLKCFIFDEPTHGVDVGAKLAIYDFLNELLKKGSAIILISSELPEILNLSHRIIVISNFRIVGELSKDKASEEEILRCFFRIGDAIN